MMEIIITQWALNSYLELRDRYFSRQEYKEILRPDVLLLKEYPYHPNFDNNDKFWSPATITGGKTIKDGYKMKWHNLGNGNVQLRLPVGVFTECFLCQAYVKGNINKERRELLKFKKRLKHILDGNYIERGRLK